MRIGIVANTDEQVVRFLTVLSGQDVLWLAGTELAQDYNYPLYTDYAQAAMEIEVDLVLDGIGGADIPGAMVVREEAALFLLQSGKGQEPAAMLDAARQLSSATESIVSNLQVLENYTQKLSGASQELAYSSQTIVDDLERTGRILESITRIAKRSKIIGLNSAIEAARVGEQGRGFAVVAEEIKALADDSSQSVQDIKRILEGIQQQSSDLIQRTGTVQDVTQQQEEKTREISSLLQALKELGNHLHKLAEEPA